MSSLAEFLWNHLKERWRVEHGGGLPIMCDALASIPSTAQRLMAVILALGKQRQEVQFKVSLGYLLGKFKASLCYVRTCTLTHTTCTYIHTHNTHLT